MARRPRNQFDPGNSSNPKPMLGQGRGVNRLRTRERLADEQGASPARRRDREGIDFRPRGGGPRPAEQFTVTVGDFIGIVGYSQNFAGGFGAIAPTEFEGVPVNELAAFPGDPDIQLRFGDGDVQIRLVSQIVLTAGSAGPVTLLWNGQLYTAQSQAIRDEFLAANPGPLAVTLLAL